jgi:hypothetical protein
MNHWAFPDRVVMGGMNLPLLLAPQALVISCLSQRMAW